MFRFLRGVGADVATANVAEASVKFIQHGWNICDAFAWAGQKQPKSMADIGANHCLVGSD